VANTGRKGRLTDLSAKYQRLEFKTERIKPQTFKDSHNRALAQHNIVETRNNRGRKTKTLVS
jgi:hypothetical protein